ncbi:uncharacterized protein LOC142345701 isoform X1 [Convolutriloba macropyga]|uniref:uncharacterized protein LOC142345701 isoform X1 n=1 Tax=Convolutriloba macropyga TaxID=536237 RepID=UPI003F51BD6A
MKYVAACMLVHLSGKVPNKENVTAVLEAIGAEVEDKYLNSVLEKLKGQNIEGLIASGSSKMASVPSGGGAVAAGGGGGVAAGGADAPAEEKKEEKKEESEEESDDDMGFGLFD